MDYRKLKIHIKNIPILGKLLKIAYRTFFVKKLAPYDPPSAWLQKLIQDDDVQIVQIGSNDGMNGDPIFDLIARNQKWKALFVEPVPYLFERLKKNYGPDSRFSFENAAINDGTKQIFYSVKEEAKNDFPDLPKAYDQLGSFYKENILIHFNGILEPYILETELEGLSLTQLFQKHDITELTLLHIDTEGYDWKIISQLNLEDIKPKVILIEHKHLTRIERKSLINFLKPDYLIFKLGNDLIGILNTPVNKNNIKGLQGIQIV